MIQATRSPYSILPNPPLPGRRTTIFRKIKRTWKISSRSAFLLKTYSLTNSWSGRSTPLTPKESFKLSRWNSSSRIRQEPKWAFKRRKCFRCSFQNSPIYRRWMPTSTSTIKIGNWKKNMVEKWTSPFTSSTIIAEGHNRTSASVLNY